MHVVGEAQHAHPVALAGGHIGQQQHRVDHIIQLGNIGHRALHHASHIQHGDHLLAALGLIFRGHGEIPPGGRLPVDAAVLVVGQVLAQALELRPFAELARRAQAHLLQTVAPQQQIIAPHIQQIGIDLHRLLRLHLGLADHQSQRTQPAQAQIAELIIPAPQRTDVIDGFPGPARRDMSLQGARLDLEQLRRLIPDREIDSRARSGSASKGGSDFPLPAITSYHASRTRSNWLIFPPCASRNRSWPGRTGHSPTRPIP